MLLGADTPVVQVYSPQLLYPIVRSEGRALIGLDQDKPIYGADIWHAYEVSWLDSSGKPTARVARFTVPASSPNIVESKSFKFYLYSLNNTRFDSEEIVRKTIVRDVSAVAGEEVQLELFSPEDPSLSGASPPGVCLDELNIDGIADCPHRELLQADESRLVEEQLYSHLLRSLCPVTGQPDWATVCIHYRGPAIDHTSLLTYIVAYRDHREFHEQCLERMFKDLHDQLTPELLTIQALYTRRGGLDISPLRSTHKGFQALGRLLRQ